MSTLFSDNIYSRDMIWSKRWKTHYHSGLSLLFSSSSLPPSPVHLWWHLSTLINDFVNMTETSWAVCQQDEITTVQYAGNDRFAAISLYECEVYIWDCRNNNYGVRSLEGKGLKFKLVGEGYFIDESHLNGKLWVVSVFFYCLRKEITTFTFQTKESRKEFPMLFALYVQNQ